MKKFKIILFIVMSLMAQSALSQTLIQQGYVKTKGYMENGHLVPGKPLSGVVIQIKDHPAIVTNNDGKFSFPVTNNEKSYTISSIDKKGYVTIDSELLNKSLRYNINPIVIVLESPEQQLQDQLAVERKIRRSLTNQLHQRENEISNLKTQQKISDEEYLQLLQKLYEETDQNEQLVKEMVERYSKIDYDQLNEFDQQISNHIMNGELAQADSMLNLKVNVSRRLEEIKKSDKEFDNIEIEIEKMKKLLEHSRHSYESHKKELEDDLLFKYRYHILRSENDSAIYYLELRAQIDTSDFQLATETGTLLLNDFLNDKKALYYYQKALRIAENNPETQNSDIATSYQNIGKVYYSQGNFKKAIELYNKALSIQQKATGDSLLPLAQSYTLIGIAHNSIQNFDSALSNFGRALKTYKFIYGQNSIETAACYNNIGVAFENSRNYLKALKYYTKALEIRLSLYDYDHTDIAASYSNIAGIYDYLESFDKAIEYYNKSIKIIKSARGNMHPDVAIIYDNIAATYYNMNDFSNSLSYFEQALTIMELFLPADHPNIKTVQENISILKNEMATDYQKHRAGMYDDDLEIILDDEMDRINNEHHLKLLR